MQTEAEENAASFSFVLEHNRHVILVAFRNHTLPSGSGLDSQCEAPAIQLTKKTTGEIKLRRAVHIKLHKLMHMCSCLGGLLVVNCLTGGADPEAGRGRGQQYLQHAVNCISGQSCRQAIH